MIATDGWLKSLPINPYPIQNPKWYNSLMNAKQNHLNTLVDNKRKTKSFGLFFAKGNKIVLIMGRRRIELL
ncbi:MULTISPECIES: hypothetical protein [Nostocaceae]|uniref:hypothetical protein n=1 Tax=Nostocaceae TaxID=1162 RepID=UPI001683F5A7|nr:MULTISPECIES: hypothetical protein [Nostocaceae]MBD2479717.1 hypothetical protein [Anabaena sp. FACHB-83]